MRWAAWPGSHPRRWRVAVCWLGAAGREAAGVSAHVAAGCFLSLSLSQARDVVGVWIGGWASREKEKERENVDG